MIITNSRCALVGYFITSYPTRAHGIIVKYYNSVQDKNQKYSTRLREKKYRDYGVHSPETRDEVYCFRLNFSLSKLGNFFSFIGQFSQRNCSVVDWRLSSLKINRDHHRGRLLSSNRDRFAYYRCFQYLGILFIQFLVSGPQSYGGNKFDAIPRADGAFTLFSQPHHRLPKLTIRGTD